MYIPPANIIETGYTQGYQYLLPSGEYYKGFYHKDKAGRDWTGKEHTNTSVVLNNLSGDKTPIDLNTISKNNPISKDFTKIYTQNIGTPLLKNSIKT